MLYETLSQGREFAAMMAAGMAMGVAAFIFQGIRRVMCVGKWGCLICDCIMGVVWAGIACISLFMACQGAARAFHFLAMLSGGLLFQGLVSPAAWNFMGRICAIARRMGRKIGENRLLKAVFR